MKSLLILKTGSTMPAIAARFGDFEVWFRATLDAGQPTAVADATHTAELPDAKTFCGVIITGSPAMVSHREPWSERAAAWLKQAYQDEVPLFGVCYGHQLLAHALGGKVGPNPAGRHIGTATINLTESGHSDPLLGTLATQTLVNVTHMERVLEAPPGASVLATAAVDPNHALRHGPLAWGVQFHPEIDAGIMRAYIQQRRAQIDEEGLDSHVIEAATQETPQARNLLAAFAAFCRQRVQKADAEVAA